MIIITTKKGQVFKYQGTIDIYKSGVAIGINAMYNYKGEPFSWDRKSMDLFWLEDIESIVGVNNEKIKTTRN